MSLINQMLQDLDARKVAHGPSSGLPNDVRPLPRPQASRWPIILGIFVLLILGAAFAAYWQMTNAKVAVPDLPPAPVVIAPPLVVTEPEPQAIAPPPLPATEAPPVESSAGESELPILKGSLRMDDILDLPAKKASHTKEARASQPPGKEHNKPENAQKPSPALDNAAPAAAPAPTDKSSKSPLIEKTDALASPRERVEAEYRKAITAVNQGRVDEALAGLRNALRQDAFHQASRQLLVKLLLEAKRSDEAERILQEGLQGQPAQLGWAMTLARLQVDRGDLAGAWQTLNYSQPAASGNADYQGFSGHVLQRLGRDKDATERYLAAVRLSPNDGRWWLGLGLSLESQGRASEAREAFQHAKQSGNLSAELMALINQKLK